MTKKSIATKPRGKERVRKSLPPTEPVPRLPVLPAAVTEPPTQGADAPADPWFLALGPFDKAGLETLVDRLLVALDTEVTLYALGPGASRWQNVANLVGKGSLDPPTPLREEQSTRTAAEAFGASCVKPEGPPPMPPPVPKAAQQPRSASQPRVKDKRHDERTPTKPVSLKLLVDSRGEALSSLALDDPTVNVEVPATHAEHANLTRELADFDIDAVSFPQPVASTPAAAAPEVVIESSVETRRESEPSINFLLEPEGAVSRDREQSTSVSLAIQRITGLDLEQLMASSESEGESNKRSHPRYRLATSVNLASEHNFWTGLTQDLSGGGIFVATYATLPLGAQVLVALTLPDRGPKLEIKAEVRWLRVMREDLDQSPGMGLRFLNLSATGRRRIERCLRSRDAILYEE